MSKVDPWQFDRIHMGHTTYPGMLLEVWEPRWWQIKRWWAWFITWRKGDTLRGTVQLVLHGPKRVEVPLRVVKAQIADEWRKGR